MEQLVAVILAAGKGTRMKSDLVKVLHPIAGLPMLNYPMRAARAAGCGTIIVVAGHQKEQVEHALRGEKVLYAYQERQLGSGHAVAVAEGLLHGFTGDVLILCGDVPLITPRTLSGFVQAHRDAQAALSVLSVVLEDPFGYGRILRDDVGRCVGIVEERDAAADQKKIREINTGLYCCRSPLLFDALKQVGTDNDQGEYYLPDIVKICAAQGNRVQAVATDDFEEVRGINDRIGLAEAGKVMRRRILGEHMLEGVTVVDPDTTCIDAGVRIGRDTVIHPYTAIRGASIIGTGCVIGTHCSVEDAVIGNNVHLRPSSVIEECTIKDGARIGPLAHLRQQAVIEPGAVIGNFVEVKHSRVGEGSKACHLSYLGDARVGRRVNIGAGTITCNFDGTSKHQTVIEDGAFVGSNATLIAPLAIGKQAVIGAGSTITDDVPEKALGIARSTQRILPEHPAGAADTKESEGTD